LLAVADPHRRRRHRKRLLAKLALVTAAVFVAALLQQWLAAAIEHNPDVRWDDLFAIGAGPLLLTVAVARKWPRPKLFFALLGSFYLAELLIVTVHGGPIGPSLVARLLEGRLQYVLFIGLEILTAMGVMLLPDPTAAGPCKLPKGVR
jgi:hypothetical protein